MSTLTHIDRCGVVYLLAKRNQERIILTWTGSRMEEMVRLEPRGRKEEKVVVIVISLGTNGKQFVGKRRSVTRFAKYI